MQFFMPELCQHTVPLSRWKQSCSDRYVLFQQCWDIRMHTCWLKHYRGCYPSEIKGKQTKTMICVDLTELHRQRKNIASGTSYDLYNLFSFILRGKMNFVLDSQKYIFFPHWVFFFFHFDRSVLRHDSSSCSIFLQLVWRNWQDV